MAEQYGSNKYLDRQNRLKCLSRGLSGDSGSPKGTHKSSEMARLLLPIQPILGSDKRKTKQTTKFIDK